MRRLAEMRIGVRHSDSRAKDWTRCIVANLSAPSVLTLPILSPDAQSDALRDDLAQTRRERDLYRLMLHAAMDQLALVATAPERYEQIQRELLHDRREFMARAMTGGEAC